MTWWGLVLVIAGLALSIWGANARLATKLGERPGARGSMGRVAVQLGLGLLAVGVALFVLGVIVHTIMAVVTAAVFVAVIVGILMLVSWLGRSRATK